MGDLRDLVPVLLPIYLVLSFVVVAFEESDHYVEAAAVTVVAVLVLVYVLILPGLGRRRVAERWAAGHEVDRARALDATYTWARGAVARAVAATLFRQRCYRSLSVRSPGRPGRDSSSTGSWAPSSGIAVQLIVCAQLRGSSAAASQGRHRR